MSLCYLKSIPGLLSKVCFVEFLFMYRNWFCLKIYLFSNYFFLYLMDWWCIFSVSLLEYGYFLLPYYVSLMDNLILRIKVIITIKILGLCL